MSREKSHSFYDLPECHDDYLQQCTGTSTSPSTPPRCSEISFTYTVFRMLVNHMATRYIRSRRRKCRFRKRRIRGNDVWKSLLPRVVTGPDIAFGSAFSNETHDFYLSSLFVVEFHSLFYRSNWFPKAIIRQNTFLPS